MFQAKVNKWPKRALALLVLPFFATKAYGQETSDVTISGIFTTVTKPRAQQHNQSLIISMHGWGMRQETYRHFLPVYKTVKKQNFILIEPKATFLGNWNWSKPEEKIPELISYAVAEWGIARDRVYLIGHSAGAQAAFKVAHKIGGIAGIIALSGSGKAPIVPTPLISFCTTSPNA